MPLRVFNTLSRHKEAFQPLVPGKVGIYLCGPTVYSDSHIGHMVGPVVFDAVKRWLEFSGFAVTFVINITDVDDKIIAQSAKEGVAWDALARRVTADYHDCLRKLDVRVDHFPHATKHIPQMLAMIGTLVEKGHAYAAGGDVYFDVTTDPGYGKLSNRKLDEMLAGTRKEVSDLKRNAGDFALWKGAKPGEPQWESPWGPGRPGWHIECSAMSRELLGATFDIHGGGLDLQFPHHEDEIAQSECCNGQPFAKYWMHNGLLKRGSGPKMGKSEGNAITMKALFGKFAPEQLRFLILNTHYRSPIDFHDDSVAQTVAGLERLRTLRERLERILGQPFAGLSGPRRGPLAAGAGTPFLKEVEALRAKFFDFMDDDFNTGGAVGVLFEMAPVLNRFADEAKLETSAASAADRAAFAAVAGAFRELAGLLGLTLASAAPAAGDGLAGKLLDLLVELRNDARKSKNFALSDAIRDKLKALNIAFEDSAQGTRWKIG